MDGAGILGFDNTQFSVGVEMGDDYALGECESFKCLGLVVEWWIVSLDLTSMLIVLGGESKREWEPCTEGVVSCLLNVGECLLTL